jgi:hypothetical protein
MVFSPKARSAGLASFPAMLLPFSLLQNSPLRVKLSEGEKVFLVKNGVIYVRENRVTVTADEIQSA